MSEQQRQRPRVKTVRIAVARAMRREWPGMMGAPPFYMHAEIMKELTSQRRFYGR